MSAVLGPGVDEPVCPRCCSRRCASIPARTAYRAAFKAWPRDATDADYDAIDALRNAIPEDCEPASPWKLVERVEALTEENARLRAALSAPPPDAEIERLVDALINCADGQGYARGKGHAYQMTALPRARSALLAAISRRVPGDLGATLIDLADDLLDVPLADGDAGPPIRAVARRLRQLAANLAPPAPAGKVER